MGCLEISDVRHIYSKYKPTPTLLILLSKYILYKAYIFRIIYIQGVFFGVERCEIAIPITQKSETQQLLRLNNIKFEALQTLICSCFHLCEKIFVPLRLNYIALNPFCRSQTSSFMA